MKRTGRILANLAWPLVIAVSLSTCTAAEQESQAARSGSAESQARGPARFASVEGFDVPESVKYDADQDIYFVTNIRGGALSKDDDGFISRVRPDGSIEQLKFVEGGANGVTLHAPKGMALAGDTLWVADIDAVRGFDRRTGAPVANIDLGPAGALFLNDLTVGPDGSIYVTDTGLRSNPDGGISHTGPDRIFRIRPDRQVGVPLEGDTLAGPNGILWDEANDRFVVASLRGPTIFEWRPGDLGLSLLASGAGGFDGVERLPDGRLLVSSLSASAVYVLADGELRPLIEGVKNPADIGVDARRNRVLIPTLSENTVEIWALQ